MGDTFDLTQGGTVTWSGQLADRAATVGDVLTVQADESIAAAPGGGAQTVECVRFPIAFDTPGIGPQSFPIIAVDVPGLSVTVAGDRTAAFAVGVGFTIVGSTANDQTASVTSVALVDGDTVIAGNFFFLAPTVDGNAVVAVGLPIYTPTVGDVMFAMDTIPDIRGSISQAWNGSSPLLRLATETGRQAQVAYNTHIDVTVADDDAFGTGTVFVNFPGFPAASTHRLIRFATADPLLVWIDDSNGLDPGSTQGAGELVFLILAAQ